MTAAWVVGAGGLLGRSIVNELRAAGTDVYTPPMPLAWDDGRTLERQLAEAIDGFASRAVAAGSWEIHWAAGVSGMASPEPALATETRRLEMLLDRVAGRTGLAPERGAFSLASTAGGIYAGSSAATVDESTPPAPTTAYAHGKLRQEESVRRSALAAAGCPILLARISTLYGPGQASGKRQGLIAHVARSVLVNRPVQVFVPLDTVRDYVHCRDAARIILASLRSRPRVPTVRIVASERPTTVAEILGLFRRVSRKRLLFTTAVAPTSGLYARRVRFRSRVMPEHSRLATTPLLVGISQVLQAERSTMAARGAAGPSGGRR